MATKAADQLALDEKIVPDAELEAVLEDYWTKKLAAGAANKEKTAAATTAKAMAARLELPEGVVARVGRFRITRSEIDAKSVAFETKPRTQYSFGLAVDEDAVSTSAEADESAKTAERRLRSVN